MRRECQSREWTISYFSIADDEDEMNDCGQMFTRSLEAYLKAVQHRKRERQVGVESRLVACASFCKEYRWVTVACPPIYDSESARLRLKIYSECLQQAAISSSTLCSLLVLSVPRNPGSLSILVLSS